LPAVKVLYERGLALFKTEKWEAMENYLSHKSGELGFIDRMNLVVLIAMPELCTSFLSTMTLQAGFCFLPETTQTEIFAAVLKWGESIEDAQKKKTYCEETLKPCFLSLSESLKTQYYPSLVNLDKTFFTKKFKEKIPRSCIDQYEQKCEQIKQQHLKLFGEIQKNLEEMSQQMKELPKPKKDHPLSGEDEGCLNNLNEQLVTLRGKLKHFISDCNLYCPELSLSPRFEGDKQCYKALHSDLLRGSFQQELQKLTSLQASALNAASESDAESFDLEEGIGSYILMHYANENRNGGLILFQQVAERFAVGPQDLDGLEEALKPLGIETVGKFIDAIFLGNKKGFDDAKVLLEKLDAYLKARKEPEESLRGKIYTALAGSTFSGAIKTVGSHSTQIVNTANKVIYKAVMILSTVAPITYQPAVFVATFAGTVVWNLTYAVAGHLIPQNVKSLWNSMRNAHQIQVIEFAIQAASRRPFLNLFSSLDYIDYEMHTYLATDFFGKMRMLSAELFYGVLVSYVKLGSPSSVRVGGFVAGVAVGNEATQLIQKAWKKIAA
ncbi:MAG: hypothetical protein ACXVAJ_08485, partial [Parachlamydiaceae bacterium]